MDNLTNCTEAIIYTQTTLLNLASFLQIVLSGLGLALICINIRVFYKRREALHPNYIVRLSESIRFEQFFLGTFGRDVFVLCITLCFDFVSSRLQAGNLHKIASTGCLKIIALLLTLL